MPCAMRPLKGRRLGELLFDVHRVVIARRAGEQDNVGFGNRLGEDRAHTDFEVFVVVAVQGVQV